jgi:hypothetical protein
MRVSWAVLLGLSWLLIGCAATPSAPALPWWVARPSAELPKGFPPPGPVDEIIIKEYPAYRSAVMRSADGKSTANDLFFPLFSHIEKNRIPMSSPVEMTYASPETANPQSMAFIYGDREQGKPGADGKVQVVDFPAVRVLSVGVTGSYSDDRFAAAYAKLRQWLAAHADEYVRDGAPRYLAYNSPLVLPFARYGEVQVPMRAVTPAKP